jgi:RNA polymerase sigma-70 factor (ECF subfamily)
MPRRRTADDLPSSSTPILEQRDDDPDARLMMLVREGDRDAFRTLFERHAAGIARFAAHFLGNSARGEEIAQEVFLQLYRARERYEPRARFSTYLYTIAQNLCRNEVRRPEYRTRPEPLDPGRDSALDLAALAAAGSSAGEGEAEASSRELAERLRTLLAELPEAQRTALVLSRSHELRYQEIGEILSCSEQAVKSLIFRATRRLKEGLKEYLEER